MNLTQRHVLVTGGAGFIGSELVRQLAEQNAEVVVVDNLVNGRRENLEGVLSDRVQLVVADIRDDEQMARLLREVQVVFHLACLGVRHSFHSPRENHEVNATATLQLLALARAAHVSRFVNVSSSEVYGTASQVPMTEDHPTFPTTVYGASKLAGECYARAYFQSYSYPTTIVRPFNSFGPRSHHEGDSGEVIPKFMLRSLAGKPMVVFGDGTQTRDFSYVSDTARGILLAVASEAAIGQTLNLGQGREISINELAATIAAIVKRNDLPIVHAQPRPGDVLRLYADSGRARQVLEYTPSISLERGLQMLHQWYLTSGESIEELLADERVYNWQVEGTLI
jgi:UDP-glucose 4-epimerase